MCELPLLEYAALAGDRVVSFVSVSLKSDLLDLNLEFPRVEFSTRGKSGRGLLTSISELENSIPCGSGSEFGLPPSPLEDKTTRLR